MQAADLINDISIDTAQRAYYGVSMFPERRAESTRSEYAATLADDHAELELQAKKGGTLDILPAEFARYREGYRRRYHAYLHSNSRCVSWFVAGPSNFPSARMNKRADIAHRRLNDLLEFRSRALAAIKRTLRPDLAPVYSSDANALERLDAKIATAEALQARMKATNATIRKYAKEDHQAQVSALLAMGYPVGVAQSLLTPDFCGRIGFADFELTNNRANIRRMQERIQRITQMRATPGMEIDGTNARVEDCPSENRVKLFFPGKPVEAIRARLKSNGFRWAPTEGCWKAYRHQNTIDLAKEIAA